MSLPLPGDLDGAVRYFLEHHPDIPAEVVEELFAQQPTEAARDDLRERLARALRGA